MEAAFNYEAFSKRLIEDIRGGKSLNRQGRYFYTAHQGGA